MADSHWLSPKKVPPGPLHPSGWRGPLFFFSRKRSRSQNGFRMFSLKEKGQVGILGRTHVGGDLEHLFDLTISPNLQVLLVALNISSPPPSRHF